MWEDNNPLSYDHRSPTSSFTPNDHSYASSPPAFSPTFNSNHINYQSNMSTQISEHDEDGIPTPHRPPSPHDSDDDSDDDDYPAARRSAGYNSRVERVLAENRDLGITIIDAGKNVEGGGGGYIVYTIRTGVWAPIS